MSYADTGMWELPGGQQHARAEALQGLAVDDEYGGHACFSMLDGGVSADVIDGTHVGKRE